MRPASAPATAVASADGAGAAGRRSITRTVILVLAAVLAVPLIATAVAPQLLADMLPARVQDALAVAAQALVQTLPWVLLGVLLAVVVQVWLPADAIPRWLPTQAWPRRILLSLLGILLPVGEGGNVPLARGLMMRGVGAADALTLVIAAPVLNPVVIITTHIAFGWDGGVLAARVLGGLLIANLIGWVYSRHPDPGSLLTASFTADRDRIIREPGSPVRRSLRQLLIELRVLIPVLVIGSALAGALQLIVPREVLLSIAANPVLSVLALIALAMTVAIASNADAMVALSLASTFSPGAVVAFLLAGPLVDVKMIALLRTTFTTRALAGVVGIVVLSACAIGLAVSVLV